jgi:YHS domain-containing protein
MTSLSLIRRLILAAALPMALLASPSHAGPHNATDGVAIKGYDPVAYFTDHAAVRGSDAFTAQFAGATFKFASAAHRETFLADPAKYAPKYDGFCAYGTASGYKADTDPEAFTVYEDHLYLNYNKDVRTKWAQDIPGYLAKAEKNWPEVEKSTKIYH